MVDFYTFLVSEVTWGYLLTIEDLYLVSIKEGEHITFVFLGLKQNTQYDIF